MKWVLTTTSDGYSVSPMMNTEIDRSEISRALAKAIAYKQCGKDKEASEWARRLVELLGCYDILNVETIN